MPDDLLSEGTIAFFVKHKHADWTSNADRYRFPDVRRDPIAVSAVKQPDGTIEITISGPFGGRYAFAAPIPPCDERGLHINLTWVDRRVMLSLNGADIETQRAAISVH
jgi:hypothetical protein